jgi:archaellum component FlaC
MDDQLDALRTSVVAAVQQELTRYNEMVATEIQRLRADVAAERAARERTEEQLLALMPAVERSHAANQAFQTDIQRALENRLGEFAAAAQRRQNDVDARIGRVVDDANIGLAATVESVARPLMKQVELRQEQLATDLAAVDRSVRKFDGQAAQMVAHFNAITEATDARLDEISTQVTEQIDGRLLVVSTRLDEVSAQAARHQSEVSNIVGARVDQAEDRINERILLTEGRINETLGQRLADVDAYVGRVAAGLDESVIMLNDRIAAVDSRFAEVTHMFDQMAQRLAAVDVDAIGEMKDRVAGLAGEVELVRIEVERFQASMGDTMDKAVLRIVDLETQLQEQHLDVETAVQLERLEEVERALLALDPNQFVRKADAPKTATNGHDGFATPSASAPFSAPTPFSPPVNTPH